MTNEAYDLKLLEVLDKCRYPDVAKAQFDMTLTLLQREGINMTNLQSITLLSHLCGMVERNYEGGVIPHVDKNMFRGVSDNLMDLADRICQLLPNLVKEEKYLLSIHFEAAKLTGA